MEEQDTTEVYAEMVSGTLLEKQKFRDVLKNVVIKADDRCRYLLIGIENQTAVNYAMVARVMFYDAINYMDQTDLLSKQRRAAGGPHGRIQASIAGMRKGDTLTPVITIVVYFGTDDWDAPCSLHELLPDGLPKEVMDLVPDYKITVLSPKEVKDPTVFKTDLRAIIRALSVGDKENRKQMQEMLSHDPDFLSIDRRAAVIINEVTQMGIKIPDNRKEVNMCEAVREWKQELFTEGEAKGEAKLIHLIGAMAKGSDADDIQRVAVDDAFREAMYKKYGIR